MSFTALYGEAITAKGRLMVWPGFCFQVDYSDDMDTMRTPAPHMDNRETQENEWYIIRNSRIHGRGVYARKFIPKDTWIVEYVGEKVDKDESERRSNALLDKAKTDGGAKVYMFILNDEWDIDGSVEWNTARLINHSCEPNVEAQTWDEKEIWIVALRDIEKGEELAFNYGFDLETWEDHPCMCGKPSCVGYIVADEYWPALRKKIAARKARETRKQKQLNAKLIPLCGVA